MNDLGRIYLSGCHVYCPVRRADLDIETCFGCARLKEVNEQRSPCYVVCDATARAELGDADPHVMVVAAQPGAR